MGNGLSVYAESNSPTGNRSSENLFGWTHLEEERGFHLIFDASGSYGPASGYTQTPLGGAPSSSSNKRPKFDELGINTTTMVNLSLSASMDSHYVFGSAHLMDLNGDSTLDEALIFHGKGYPAGTRIKANVKSDWYEIGYQYNIHFGKERVDFSIAPTVAFALWDFSTELESNGQRNDRSYLRGTPRLGVNLEWIPLRQFSVSGKAIGSAPLKNTANIYTVGLIGKYNLLRKDRLKISLSMGVEYNQINFKDSQTEPNQVKVNTGPLGLLGVEVRF